jgi:predicted PhzF superfamily epimerase YddE/YHI9
MNFPVRPSEPVPAPPGLAEALGVVPAEALVDAFNYMAVLESAQVVRALAPDIAAIARLDRSGVIATAPGDETYDFVSRYFAPAKGIPEDPVTGGAHCALVPYWAKRLGKTEFRAFQASRRGGEIPLPAGSTIVSSSKALASSTWRERRRSAGDRAPEGDGLPESRPGETLPGEKHAVPVALEC